MHRDLADQRDVFFFYLAVFSCANSTCKVKKGERLLASNLGISFFPSYCFGVAVKVNSFVFETYPRPRR